MRLFVALEIPAAVRDNLATFIGDMQTRMRDFSEQLAEERVRWVRAENLHVTLKFIGEVAPIMMDGLRAALATVRGHAPLELRVHGLGFFPKQSRPTVLWTGLEASAELPALAEKIDSALATQNIAREERAFVPHLTLARFAPPLSHEKLRAAIQENAARDFGSFEAREFHLIESKRKPSGAEYTTLHSFPAGAES